MHFLTPFRIFIFFTWPALELAPLSFLLCAVKKKKNEKKKESHQAKNNNCQNRELAGFLKLFLFSEFACTLKKRSARLYAVPEITHSISNFYLNIKYFQAVDMDLQLLVQITKCCLSV